MKTIAAILARISLPEINRVTFYKRDEITTDLICCDVEALDQTWTFHEEMMGWSDLISYLQSLPDFRSDWYGEVVQSPFASSEIVAYHRK